MGYKLPDKDRIRKNLQLLMSGDPVWVVKYTRHSYKPDSVKTKQPVSYLHMDYVYEGSVCSNVKPVDNSFLGHKDGKLRLLVHSTEDVEGFELSNVTYRATNIYEGESGWNEETDDMVIGHIIRVYPNLNRMYDALMTVKMKYKDCAWDIESYTKLRIILRWLSVATSDMPA